MSLLTNWNGIKKLVFIILLSLTYNQAVELKSQDLFANLPSSPTGYVTASTVSTSGDVYITIWGTGIFKSNNKGVSWVPLNVGLTNFNLTDIEIISSSEIVVTTFGGGVFKTTSMTNVVWKESSKGLTNLDTRAIRRYPNGMLVVGTYGDGVFISKDAGDNWTNSSKGLLYKDVKTIEIANNGWIVAGTYGGGIYQSRDTAKTWSRQSSGLKNQFINEIKMSNFEYLYAATNGRGVYYSVNDGIAWVELDTFMTRPLKNDPVPLPDLNATSIAFNNSHAPIFGSRYGGVYAEDVAEDFTWVPTSMRGKGVNTLCRDKDSIYGFFPSVAPRKSAHQGEVWREIAKDQFDPMKQFTKVFSHKEKEIIAYSGNTVKITTDEGKTWVNKAGTPASINKISMDSSGIFYAGTIKGLYKSINNLSSWSLVKSLDTNILDVEISQSGTIFTAEHFYKDVEFGDPIDIRKVCYTRNGNDWFESGILFDKKSVPPHDLGVNYNGIVYLAAGKVVYYSTNDGTVWIPTAAFPNEVATIGFLRDNTVIIGTMGAGLYRSTLINAFTRVDEYPAFNIETIHVGKNNYIYASGENIFIDAAFSTVEATYMSTDGGMTFININNNFNGEKVMSFTVNNVNDMYMSTMSGMLYRAVSKTNLTIPKLYDIADKTYDVDVNTMFSWSSSQRAELYQMQISYDTDFGYIWETVTQRDTVHYLHGTLLPNRTYVWRVRSKNHDAVSDWSEVRTFYSKLANPTLVSPEDKSINVAVYAPLTWNKVEGATKYMIQVSKENKFTDIEHEWQADDSTTFSPLLSGRTKYYWRVKSLNDVSSSNWSVVWSFETVFGPPSLLTPTNNAIGIVPTPVMTWRKATEVNEYDIQISDDIEFDNIVFESNSIKNTSIESSTLNYNTEYWWRVRSRNGDVVSEWSLVFKFLTGYSPVTLLTPANEAVNVVIKTVFNWEAHPTESIYELQVSKLETFSSNVISDTLENITDYTAGNLESYQDYFWRVRVISEENLGVWSEPYKYKTKVDVIGLRIPGNNTIDHPISVRFMWFNTKGATTYHLQIATDNSFNDLIFSQDTIKNVTHEFTQLNPASTYYWRARAVSPEGVGDWSDVWTFKTGNNIPILIAPLNGKDDVKVPVKFEWNPVTGAIKYEINISENDEFTPLVNSSNDINSTFYNATELLYPKTYYWRMRAITAEGPTAWSQTWSFSTKDPASVSEIISLQHTALYPNPAEQEVSISLNGLGINNAELIIMDMAGRLVEKMDVKSSSEILKWNCSQASPGVYFIRISSGSKIYTGEIIIQR